MRKIGKLHDFSQSSAPPQQETHRIGAFNEKGREGRGSWWNMTLSRARLHVGLQSGLRNENSLLQTPAPGALPRESHYARCVFPREESSWDSRSAWKCCRAAFPSVRARWSVQATHPSLAVGAFKTRCLSFALKHILSGRIWSVTVTPTLLHHPIQVTGRLDLGTN